SQTLLPVDFTYCCWIWSSAFSFPVSRPVNGLASFVRASTLALAAAIQLLTSVITRANRQAALAFLAFVGMAQAEPVANDSGLPSLLWEGVHARGTARGPSVKTVVE